MSIARPTPSNRQKILVTGARGQLGRSLVVTASHYPQIDFTFVGRQDLDLGSDEEIHKYLGMHRFNVIINCAAYTAVDRAEVETDLAERVNHNAVRTLAECAQAQGAVLMHISTDYVFDGAACIPYTEDAVTGPQSSYGATKLRGEQAVQAVSGCSLIIRTGWVYSEFGSNFVKTMLRLGEQRARSGEPLRVVFDQIGSPTYAADLAAALIEIAQSPALVGRAQTQQIYHYSNEGSASWYDFAKGIFELGGIRCPVYPIGSQEFPTPAARPHYSVLNKAKIKEHFGLEIPYWRDSLRLCMGRLENER